MKLGTIILLNELDGLEQKFQKLNTMGFDNCQIVSWEPSLWTDKTVATLGELCAKYAIEINSFWCGWEGPKEWNFYEGHTTLGLVPAKYREMRIKNLCDGADFAKKLGVTDVVTHMGFIPENPYDPEFFPLCDAIRAVAEHLKANDQNLLFETGQETPVTMLRCFETVATGNLYVNLDTANLILYGKANPVDSLDVFGSYVRHIHAKDGVYPTNGRELGHQVRLGEGKVDFHKLFQKLHELNYDQWVTIEREISGEEQERDIRDAKVFLETIINEVYGG